MKRDELGPPATGRPKKQGLLKAVGLLGTVFTLAVVVFLIEGGENGEPGARDTSKSGTTQRQSGLGVDSSQGGIDGLVLDPDGRPVEEAQVCALLQQRSAGLVLRGNEARPAFDQPVLARSGKDGRFQVTGIRAGEYLLTATAPGLVAGHHGDLRLAVGQLISGVTIRLGRGGFTVSGGVFDSGGGVLPNAKIRATLRELVPQHGGKMIAYMSGSDQAGRYVLQLPPGRYALTAEVDGYAPGRGFVDLDGDESRDFHLQPAARISGRVIASDKSAADDAEVRLEMLERPLDQESWQTKSDTQGGFTFTGLTAGTYRLIARKGGQVAASRAPVRLAVAAARDDVELQLAPGATLEGLVKSDAGKPIAGAMVWVTQEERPTRLQTQSDAEGRFRLVGLLTDIYRLRAGAEGFSAREDVVAIGEAGTLRRDIVLDAEAVVRGQVLTTAGAPVSGALVKARVKPLQPGPHVSDQTRSDERGQFTLRGLTAGHLRIAAESEQGTVQAPSQPLGRGEKKEVKLVLDAGARISGVVTWDNGSPAGKIGVLAQTRTMGITQFLDTRADAEGRFSIGPLPAGDMSVHAVPPDEERAGVRPVDAVQVDLKLAAGEHNTGVKLVLEKRSAGIRGVVVAPGGRPVGDATVQLEKEADGVARISAGSRTVATSPDGTFIVEALSKGTYTLSASHPDYPEVTRRGVSAGSAGVRLEFARGASVAGVVVTRSGQPLTAFSIQAINATPTTLSTKSGMPLPPGYGTAPLNQEVRSPTGEFKVGPLEAGIYRLIALASDGSLAEGDVTLAAGELKQGLRLQVEGGRTVSAEIRDFTTGRPLPGAVAEARVPTGEKLRAVADDGGRVVLRAVPKKARVVVRGPDPTYSQEMRPLPETDVAEVSLGVVPLVKGPEGRQNIATAPLNFNLSGDRVVIARLGPQSPALNAGFKAGDTVLAVDGRDVRGVGMDGLQKLMSGSPDSQVTLTVQTEGEPPRDLRIGRPAVP